MEGWREGEGVRVGSVPGPQLAALLGPTFSIRTVCVRVCPSWFSRDLVRLHRREEAHLLSPWGPWPTVEAQAALLLPSGLVYCH